MSQRDVGCGAGGGVSLEVSETDGSTNVLLPLVPYAVIIVIIIMDI